MTQTSNTDQKIAKTFRVVVVDDEPLARRLIIASLAEYPEFEVIAECGNGRQAVTAVNELSPDLMFLDIQMPVMGGFDVIRSVAPDKLPAVVFVTAFDAFAIDAFDANAIDYLLKPISEERFSRALARALGRLMQSQTHQADNKALVGALNVIADRVREKSETQTVGQPNDQDERKISIKDGDSVMLVTESHIDWVDAAGDYMCIHVAGETHVIRSTMHELLSRLSQDKFKRVHRSTVVNTDRIVRIQKHMKGEYFLHLDCDEIIKVSRHYKEVIREFIDRQP
ncbi:MAG: response regulator transcription factor [Pseudomonadales bacterium]|nr:response regulator transcription factor [Pseudomonadales bacterium]